MSNRKERGPAPRPGNPGAEIFGKHLSPEKQRALLIVTLTACALPMILGVRMWDRIPEIVETGLIGPGGQDDSLPRWAVALLLPGLMCLLEAVAQFMLLQYQKRMKIPPAFNRLMGRWGFPTISLLFCSGAILETSGQGLSLNFYTPCILGLVLMLLGSHMFDCTEGCQAGPAVLLYGKQSAVVERGPPVCRLALDAGGPGGGRRRYGDQRDHVLLSPAGTGSPGSAHDLRAQPRRQANG